MKKTPRKRTGPTNGYVNPLEEYGSGYAPYELSQTVAVLTQAVESNERQIHEVAINSTQGIKDLSVLIEKQGSQTNARLETLAGNFQASQKPNYMLWLAALAVFFTLVAAGSKITDLQTQVTMAPISAKAEISEKDRADLHKEITLNKETIAGVSAMQQVFTSKLAEVETQFRSSDRSRNVQFAEQQRMNNLEMQVAQGAGKDGRPLIVYPSGPYYFPETTSDGGQNAPK